MKGFVKHVALGMDGQRGYDDLDSDTDEDEDGWIPLPKRRKRSKLLEQLYRSLATSLCE